MRQLGSILELTHSLCVIVLTITSNFGLCYSIKCSIMLPPLSSALTTFRASFHLEQPHVLLGQAPPLRQQPGRRDARPPPQRAWPPRRSVLHRAAGRARFVSAGPHPLIAEGARFEGLHDVIGSIFDTADSLAERFPDHFRIRVELDSSHALLAPIVPPLSASLFPVEVVLGEDCGECRIAIPSWKMEGAPLGGMPPEVFLQRFDGGRGDPRRASRHSGIVAARSRTPGVVAGRRHRKQVVYVYETPAGRPQPFPVFSQLVPVYIRSIPHTRPNLAPRLATPRRQPTGQIDNKRRRVFSHSSGGDLGTARYSTSVP